MPQRERLAKAVELIHTTPSLTIKQARILAAAAGVTLELLATELCASLRQAAR